MCHMHMGGGIVIGHHHQAASHGFQRDVAKGFRFAGEQKYVSRSIVPGELFTCLHPTEEEIRMGFLQGSTQWPVPDDNKLHSSTTPLHSAVCRDGEFQVFLWRNPSHGEHDEAALRYTPRA